MNTTDAEREWVRRITGRSTAKPKKETKTDNLNESHTQTLSNNKRAGFNDIAGMQQLKEFVTQDFINVLLNYECAKAYGIKPPSMLFYGPAGCGKTFFAEKIAEEAGINFIKIVPDDLACTWVHGTQQKIGELFKNAEAKAPVLILFDEFDAMVPKRSADEANQHYNSEVNEFLCMLNNAAERGVYVVATTNSPERIDKAVLRKGRIDEIIYIDMPDKKARQSIFDLELSKLPADADIDTERLAELTDGYNCSDITYIVKAAARKMFNQTIQAKQQQLMPLSQNLLEKTIADKCPSLTGKDLREYERIRALFSPNDKQARQTAIGFR